MIVYNEKYDAYYDVEIQEWTEDVCGDERCDYCPGRPDVCLRVS